MVTWNKASSVYIYISNHLSQNSYLIEEEREHSQNRIIGEKENTHSTI